jgi:acetaldehyde dehydrogenase
MMPQVSWPVGIIGSGGVGADLMIKILNSDGPLTLAAMVGTDPDSDGLAIADRLGVATTSSGIEGLSAMPQFPDIRLVFDTTPAEARRADWADLGDNGIRVIDLSPSPIGPYCVPAVNLDEHSNARDLNMGTGGGQATIPIVAAVAQSGIVSYAEVVSAVPAAAVGPETRADIDAINETTAAAVHVVGGAQRAKSLTILNPAVPPIMMRNTVYCLVDGDVDQQRIESDVSTMVDKVQAYAPGYRLKQRIQFESFSSADPLFIPETGKFTGTRVTALLEVSGAADHLPAYAGNLDIVTAAARAAAERIAAHAAETVGLAT